MQSFSRSYCRHLKNGGSVDACSSSSNVKKMNDSYFRADNTINLDISSAVSGVDVKIIIVGGSFIFPKYFFQELELRKYANKLILSFLLNLVSVSIIVSTIRNSSDSSGYTNLYVANAVSSLFSPLS